MKKRWGGRNRNPSDNEDRGKWESLNRGESSWALRHGWARAMSHYPFVIPCLSLTLSLSFSGPSVLGHPRDMGQPLPGTKIDLDETGRENLPPARPGVIGAGLPWSARPSASQARRPGVLTLGSRGEGGGSQRRKRGMDGNDDGDGTH